MIMVTQVASQNNGRTPTAQPTDGPAGRPMAGPAPDGVAGCGAGDRWGWRWAAKWRSAQPRPIRGSERWGGEVTAGPRLQAAAPDSVEVWDVAGAPHIGGLATQPQQWETRVVCFLDRAQQ